jgi:hypothetical protein
METRDENKVLTDIMLGFHICLIEGVGILGIKMPTRSDIETAGVIYESEVSRCKGMGILTSSEMDDLLVKRGIFEEGVKNKTAELYEQLYKGLRIIEKIKYDKAKESIQFRIDQIKTEIAGLEAKENEYYRNTAEFKGEEARQLYILSRCVLEYPHFNELKWKMYDDILKERINVLLCRKIISEIIDYSRGADVKIMRSIARGSGLPGAEWRIRWNTSKCVSSPIFREPISEWNNDRTQLAMWSIYYDNIYESMDRPPESTINNDEAVDEWVKQQNRKNAATTGAGHKMKSAYDHKEVIEIMKPEQSMAVEAEKFLGQR